MKRTPDHKSAHKLACVWAKTTINRLDADFRLRGQVNDLCIELFDRWCERRELTPLVYLLHAWPILPSTPRAIEALLGALRDLRIFHAEALDDLEHQLIDTIQVLAEC